MNLWELLFWGMAGWTAIGLIGLVTSLARRERGRIRRGVAWLAGVWVVYLATLVGVSLRQPQRVVAIGQEQCFGAMCFTVMHVEEVPGFLIRDGSRLLRVSVRVRNSGHGGAKADTEMQAYVVDAQGRQWKESAGVGGVGLNVKVPAGESVVSEPVFKVASNATDLGLVFTRGGRQPGALVIGDSDSLLHRRTVVKLGQ